MRLSRDPRIEEISVTLALQGEGKIFYTTGFGFGSYKTKTQEMHKDISQKALSAKTSNEYVPLTSNSANFGLRCHYN